MIERRHLIKFGQIFFEKYDLEQHVNEPSRATSNNTLDLLISSKSQEVPYSQVSNKRAVWNKRAVQGELFSAN